MVTSKFKTNRKTIFESTPFGGTGSFSSRKFFIKILKRKLFFLAEVLQKSGQSKRYHDLIQQKRFVKLDCCSFSLLESGVMIISREY